ncbi:unnamed protein product [Parnassius apollo]|uniref:(apollo) hypothetical protein n=1 Tax=Parnassius apollo TaxID=110799 RepID=A0A8S3WC89_PARAO|nr:unnamed protein product [Parnassius apollo]
MLNGTEKGFDMDTTEDSTEAPTLYPDNLAYGVKSPTSELARLEQRQSHNVQLMKASLYADIEDMEEEGSVSTGDQLVPEGSSVAVESVTRHDAVSYDTRDTVATKHDTEEAVMKPLVVRPHRIVLEYHRKMPPFKETIAGRLGGACLADMNVCRARHSRLGFGPANTMVYVTSYDSLAHLPRSAELSELGRYVRGRGADDWSEPVVARLAIGHSTSEKDTLALQLESLLQFSQLVQEEPCPRLQLSQEPKQRRALLQQLLQHAQSDVTDTYSLQVWKLCDALWGADLDNDGIPGQDLQSIVHRHRRLLGWLQDAVADVTQHDLKMPATADSIDESDGHSCRVWTLLLGGRVLEACKVARENGDLHMATLLAQAASDPAFRSLVAKQLHLWQECGAHELVAKPRLAALQLIAGLRPRAELEQLDWLRALHATARYLCPQVPSLEQIVRTYESYFRTDLTNPDGKGRDGEDGELDLTTVPEDDMGMRLPLPPYFEQYEYNVTGESKRRRVLDLRYELLRARALNCRARLQPAAHTADPLDYSLTFVVGAWLGQPTAESITGAAAQLEARGHWHRAVQALAYLQDPGMRGHLIRGVLSRNAPCHEEGAAREQLQLVRGLKLPAAWLLLAQAHRAKYQHQPMLEAEYLVGAEQWNAAHKVLVDELLADAVLADNVQSLRPLLEKMNEAAERHEISGWESGGKALYHYMYVCDEVRDLVAAAEGEAPGDHNQGGPALQTRLEALRPRLAAACSALEKLPPRTGRQAAARSEMGARLVQLALAGGPSPGHLAALLRSLQLPPDCTARAHHKVTTDLAEQASELCVDCLRAPLHLQRV